MRSALFFSALLLAVLLAASPTAAQLVTDHKFVDPVCKSKRNPTKSFASGQCIPSNGPGNVTEKLVCKNVPGATCVDLQLFNDDKHCSGSPNRLVSQRCGYCRYSPWLGYYQATNCSGGSATLSWDCEPPSKEQLARGDESCSGVCVASDTIPASPGCKSSDLVEGWAVSAVYPCPSLIDVHSYMSDTACTSTSEIATEEYVSGKCTTRKAVDYTGLVSDTFDC